MNKLVLMGIAAVAVVLLFMVWMYSTFIDGRVAPPDKIDNTTANRLQPPPVTAFVKLPFNASAYEVNYTVTLAFSLAGITVSMEGWIVVGAGPSGGYDFGMITVPRRGTVVFKSAAEGNVTYTMTCVRGECVVIEERIPLTDLIGGANAARTFKGVCRHLNYTGMLYEERGVLDPELFSLFMEGLSGNYTAYVCEVNGVMLTADIMATSTRGVQLTLKMVAVKVGPYRPDTYRLILKEIKANR